MKQETKEVIGGVVLGLLAFGFSLAVTGCSNNRGWDFNIGVHPVSQISDHHILRYEAPSEEKKN